MKLPMFLGSKKGIIGGNRPGALPPMDNPFFREQFKALRAKIDDYFEKDGSKTLAITSAIADEGKSITCVNLGMNIASTGRKKVLLVDADMRKTGLAKDLRLKPVPGLSEYLSGSAGITDIIRNARIPGFSVIPAGSEPPSPADLLAGESFRAFLQQVREDYDLILIDTSPVLPVADAISLRELVDWFLLVFRAGYTPYPMLKQAVSDIGENKVLGVVINRVKLMEDRYYVRYYGKYYRK